MKAEIFFLLFLILISSCSSYEQKKEAIVSFTFDDAYESQYYNAYPIFANENVPATVFVIANLTSFEGKKLMDDKMLKEVSSDWEIGVHSLNHKYWENEDEMYAAKQIMIKRGFNVNGFAVPYGKYDDNSVENAKKYFSYMRTSDYGLNDPRNTDRYRLKSKWILNNTTFDEMKSWVDEADRSGGWLIIMVHIVDENNLSEDYTAKPSDLKRLIGYIQEKEIPIKSVNGVVSGMEKA